MVPFILIVITIGFLFKTSKEKNLDDIYEVLNRSKYPDKKYDFVIYPPIIGKTSVWSPLGDKLSKNETILMDIIPLEKYYTIRFDGVNFSTNMKILKRLGILEKGYSEKLELIMVNVTRVLMEQVPDVMIAFTQSDEITLLVSPCKKNIHGEYIIPDKRRRFVKYLSTLAGKVSTLFNTFLIKQMIIDNNTHLINQLPVLYFDSRIGTYNTFKDALELLLWRSYDCYINGVSSGVVLNNINVSGVKSLNTSEKLDFLHDNGLLQKMTPHQLYGTIFIFEKIECININRKTGEEVVSIKKIPLSLNNQLSNIVKENKLLVNSDDFIEIYL